MFTCQINYHDIHTRLFMRLAALMDREDLCLGPPVFHPDIGVISQLCGMCPSNAGGQSIFVHIGDDRWHVSYDDGEDSATLNGDEISKWYNGDYGDSAGL